MPYGKYGKARTARGGSRVSYKRKAPRRRVPVPKKPRPSYVRKNALAINRLSRMQRQLRNMTYGSVQVGQDIAEVQDLIVSSHTPLLMDLGDFSRKQQGISGQPNKLGARIFTIDSSIGNLGLPVVMNITSWVKGLQNPFWTGVQSDQVDGGKYKPLSGAYRFRIRCSGNLSSTRVTFHTFTMRPDAQHPATSNTTSRSMPQALIHMCNMAEPTANQFLGNKFLKLYSSKCVHFTPHKYQDHFSIGAASGSAQHQGPTVEKFMYINVKPTKVRKQEYTTPIDPLDPTTAIPDGNFGHINTPEGVPFWLLISCDQPTRTDNHDNSNANLHADLGEGQQVRISCSRTVKWRDHVGAA